VAFSPDGQTVVSASGDSTLRLWEVPGGRNIKMFRGHSRAVTAVAFGSDGRLLVSGSRDNTLRLWDVESGREMAVFSGHADSISGVAVSPDGNWLLSGSRDRTIRLWALPSGEPIYAIYDPQVTEITAGIMMEQTGLATLTLPCGAAMPAGASCICDCIATARTYPGTETVCTCNTIAAPAGTSLTAGAVCTCNTVIVGD
ncbi:MAG: hypothetical protein KDI38_27835, partial [Calditrichaeota bacterium]|nr:hypothetical protein [Calditrichota bacterium]